MKRVLVLCTGNSCRSQMAHGYLEKLTNGQAEIYSAGVETHGLNENAIRYMKEDGIDISFHQSNHVDEYGDIQFDYVITVCDHANERCPVFSNGVQKLHHNFSDPSKIDGSDEVIAQAFRKTRNEIKNYCSEFVQKYLST